MLLAFGTSNLTFHDWNSGKICIGPCFGPTGIRFINSVSPFGHDFVRCINGWETRIGFSNAFF